MDYIKSRYVNLANTFMGLLIYIVLINILKIDLSIPVILIAVTSFLAYYVLDSFDVQNNDYRLRMTLYSAVTNFIFGVIILIAKVDFISAFILYFSEFAYQNIIKYLFNRFLKKSRNVLIVGTGYKNELIRAIAEENRSYNFAGTLAKDYKDKEKYKIIGEISDIRKITKENKIDVIVIAAEKPYETSFLQTILDLKIEGVRIYDFFDFYERVTGRVPVKSINEEWFLFAHGFNIIHDSFNQRIKRIIDVFFSIIIAIPALPIIFISAIIVKIESKGPVFFMQERVGLGNKTFKMIKMRSMRIHDEAKYSKYAGEKDDRITKFGKFMRKTRIDELPQIINVLKGEMSFVGPRAEWDKLCYSYMEKIPFYNLRHIVKPGLTGWAQVNYPYGASVEDALEKLQFDLYYIKNYSLVMDIAIFFRTLKTVVFGRGR